MPEFDVDALLDSLDEPLVPERRPLPSGTDPWTVQRVNRSEVNASNYARAVETKGVTITCEVCGQQWKVHPCMAGRVFACSQSCRDKAYEKRKKEGPTRPLVNYPWKPWEHRRNHADQRPE